MIEVDLRRFSLFASLAEAELHAVARLLEAREFAAEQAVWREGEAPEGLVLLERGVFRFETLGTALGQCEAPACFGAASLVAEGPRETSAFAAAPARALLLSKTAFARLLEGSPRAAACVLQAIAAELAAVTRAGLPFFARPSSSGVDPCETGT